MASLRFLHLSPTYYSESSVVGGGEKYVIYMCRALKTVAQARELDVGLSIVAFGEKPGAYDWEPGVDCEVLAGKPWDPLSISLPELQARIARFDIVVVHQCLTTFGLFAASHAKLAGKFVIGVDEGGGEDRLVRHSREIGPIFDFLHAYSGIGIHSFADLDARAEIIRGPVDDSYYQPDPARRRDPALIVSIGRLLPHKGFDRIIRALPRDLRLVIAGGNYDADYRTHLDQLSRGKSVEIRERLTDEEVRVLMQSAGLCVQASTHFDYRGNFHPKPELLGLAALEALSCGTPTLVSSAGSLPELALLRGCLEFHDDQHLTKLLSGLDSLDFPPPDEIHRDVKRAYGLAAFGRHFLHALARLGVA